MTRTQLEAIVAGGETEQVEFKRSTGVANEGCKTACAMLNGRGGFVLFGVRDDGRIVGQQVSTKSLEDLAQELRRIEPFPLLQPDPIDIGDGLQVVALAVPGGTSGPYTYDGRPYVRVGPSTSVMPQARYRQLLLEQMHPVNRWETQVAHGFSVDHLDASEISRTVDEAVRRGRLDEPGTRDPQALLEGLELLRNGQVINAAVVLFGREEMLMPGYPQCLLRLARFRGIDKTEFLDLRQEHGNAFQLLRHAQRFLRQNLPVAGRIVPQVFERVDDPLYPPEALREALANALCHRDYNNPGGSLSIAIYDDRLEIANAGTLPFGLTPEALRKPHTSKPWNPTIAKVFYRRGIIDQWGRGTVKITELAEQAGLAAPEFEERGGEVVVRFLPLRYAPPTRVSHNLSPLQQELLDLLSHGRLVRLKELQEALPGTPPRTVQDNLQMLRGLELVTLAGKGAGARWKLRASGKAGGSTE